MQDTAGCLRLGYWIADIGIGVFSARCQVFRLLHNYVLLIAYEKLKSCVTGLNEYRRCNFVCYSKHLKLTPSSI